MNCHPPPGPANRAKNRLICTAFGLTLAGAASLLLSGCQPPFSGAPPCMPPDYVLEPSTVKAGSALKVWAPDATCNPRYGERAQIQIELLDEQNEVLLSKLAPMGDAGSFEHSLRIPADLKPGNYNISASPHGVDWCDDTGRNNRIENPDFGRSGVLVVRASCATPYEPFRVVK